MMSAEHIKNELSTKGYVVVPNVLTSEEVEIATDKFDKWRESIPDHDYIHNACDPHGIYKYHEVGHQDHAWYIRTREGVQKPFQQIWDENELIVSFDGSCYIPKESKKVNTCWTHTDQAANKKGVECFQGVVGLTHNKYRTLVVYEGSHLLHEEYFKSKGDTSSINWNLIDKEYLETIADKMRILEIPAGGMAIWDSRTFHQGCYDNVNPEERKVQYVSFMPKNHRLHTEANKKKRLKYFTERRTTSHWACHVKVNAKQPPPYGNKRRVINYDLLQKPDLNYLEDEINKILN